MRALIVALAVVVSLPVVAGAQVVTEMTPERIREAITAGGDFYPLKDGPVIFGVYSTPFSRVARAAREAKKAYRPFAESDITPEMLDPVLEISAARQWTRYGGRWKRVVAIVVAPAKSKDPSLVLRPADFTPLDSGGMVARFPLSALSEDNEVRVVYDGPVCGNDEECTVRLKPVR